MRIVSDVVYIITMIITVAIIAVILSPKAQTVGVLQAFTSGLSTLLQTVVSPVTGGTQK